MYKLDTVESEVLTVRKGAPEFSSSTSGDILQEPETNLNDLMDIKPSDEVNILQRLRGNSDKFIGLVMNYSGSKKQLQGVLAALALHPFNDKPFHWSYPEQRELFDLGNAITSDKLCIFHLGILEQQYAKEVRERTEKQAQETQEVLNEEVSS